MTHAEVRAFLASCDPGGLRHRSGITLRTVAAPLGRSQPTVWAWENRGFFPRAGLAERYCHFLQGLIRHQSVTWDEDGDDITLGEAA